MIKIKEICRMKSRCILVSLCFLFIPDCFSQKLKPVVVKKLEGDVYSKEEYSIIKRGKDKGKRHGEYTYSKFTKEMTGVYFFDLKNGEWKYDQSPDKYSEYYTRGHLDSVKGIKDGFEILMHFDELGDTSYFRQLKVDPTSVNFLNSFHRDTTIIFEDNGITFETFGDTTYYYYSPKKVLIGKTFKGQKTGKWVWNTNTIKATTFFKDGLPVGTHTSFYPNGKIMAIKSFDSLGQKQGLHTLLYKNGDTASLASYKEGLPEGTHTTFHQNGKAKSIKSFDSFGEKDGPHVVFFENGDTAYYQIFVDGAEEEPNESFYPNSDQQDSYSDWPKKAEFIGGDKRLQLFIDTHIKYPVKALKEDKQGVVQVIFVVNTIGEIENLETLGNPDGYLMLEAMRVIKSTSLLWQPTMQDGFPVSMRFKIPVKFRIY
jgi:TonB family protein